MDESEWESVKRFDKEAIFEVRSRGLVWAGVRDWLLADFGGFSLILI